MYLYHYGRTETIFSILQSKSIRLSDIRKSNDYKEMELFYPEIINRVWTYYCENPFHLTYKGKEGKEALYELLDSTAAIIDKSLEEGDFSNYVVCFSETADLLSQWRGYANLGKGCSIGFDVDILKDYCESTGVLRLEKVKYLNEKQIDELISSFAKEIVDDLNGLREWIVSEMTHDDSDPDTDGLLGFNFSGMIESFMIDSLQYKHEAFSEEKEWRLFLHNQAYKNEDLIFGEHEKIVGPRGFEKTINYMKNRIDFNVMSDNIVPYISIGFEEFEQNPVKEIWLGPKNMISEQDLKLYLRKYNYLNMGINMSRITFI